MIALRATAATAIDRLRSGDGPRFIEATTYRWREHVGPGQDYHLGYREKAEYEAWEKTDAVRVIGKRLPLDLRARIDAEVEREIASAFEYAESSPFPDPADLMTDIFTEENHELAGCQG